MHSCSKCNIKYINEAFPACKEAFAILLQFSFEKIKCIFQHAIPLQIMEESSKMMQHSFWTRALFSQMIGNNPAPYVACFLTCSHRFSMQNLCQKVQCIITIFPENPVRMTILLTNGSYSIRQYGIIWIKEAMFQQK